MTTLLALIVVLGVLIFIHELGHFITAKLAGVAVPRFSIGLGPKVWGVTVGETEYVISALPLGGYVKMAGMGEDEAMETLEGGKDDLDVPPERRFDSKSVGTRAVVISAGVVMNMVFAVIVFAGLIYSQAREPLIGEVQDGSPAAAAGVRPGDRVLAVDGQEVGRWTDFAEEVGDRSGQSVTLLVRRGGETVEIETGVERAAYGVDPTSGDTLYTGRIGVVLDTINAGRGLGLAGALVAGTERSLDISWQILEFLGNLLTGRASLRDLGGPILIGQLSGQAARAGVSVLIHFMALLSVNLAILNLLPIPILDGGHLVFLGIEAIRGRALSLEVRARLSQIGLIFIVALMVWALTADVLRITGN